MIAKGFKGKYFSLQAIAATTSCAKLTSLNSAFKSYILKIINYDKDDETCDEDPPPLESLFQKFFNFLALISKKPCFCNIFFACLAYKTLKLSRIKKPPICKCRKTKTGIAPPTSKSDFKHFIFYKLRYYLNIYNFFKNFEVRLRTFE